MFYECCCVPKSSSSSFGFVESVSWLHAHNHCPIPHPQMPNERSPRAYWHAATTMSGCDVCPCPGFESRVSNPGFESRTNPIGSTLILLAPKFRIRRCDITKFGNPRWFWTEGRTADTPGSPSAGWSVGLFVFLSGHILSEILLLLLGFLVFFFHFSILYSRY